MLARTSIAALLLVSTVISNFCACDRETDRERAAKAAADETQRKNAAIEKWRTPVNAKLARVREVVDLLHDVPAASDDAIAPKTDVPMKVRTLHLDDPSTNTDVMMQSELAFLQRGALGTCAFYLRGVPDDVGASILEDVFPACARIRFFLVVRPSMKSKPELLPNGDKYRGGAIVGDVVVFDLDAPGPPKTLGAFPIAVVLGRDVEVRVEASKSEMEYDLDDALRDEVLKAVEKKIGG